MNANWNNDEVEPKNVFHVVGKCIGLMALIRFMILIVIKQAFARLVKQVIASTNHLEHKARDFEHKPLLLLIMTFGNAVLPLKRIVLAHVP